MVFGVKNLDQAVGSRGARQCGCRPWVGYAKVCVGPGLSAQDGGLAGQWKKVVVAVQLLGAWVPALV